MAEPAGPLDRLLDVFVYLPVGLALRAAEELPKLAEAGRERVGSQAGLARMVGQMAVAQGRRQVDQVLGRRRGGSAEEPVPATVRPEGRPVPVRDLSAEEAALARPAPAAPSGAPPAGPTPAADDLPIPGYDSLSASQVVQRLNGLSPDELEAVRSYEQSGRGRKTVLLRVAQLRAAS